MVRDVAIPTKEAKLVSEPRGNEQRNNVRGGGRPYDYQKSRRPSNGRRPKRNKEPVKTSEELDKELEEFMKADVKVDAVEVKSE